MPRAKGPVIGRRTGKAIKAGRQIRILSNGLENFDDYWSETDQEESLVNLEKSKHISVTKEATKEPKVAAGVSHPNFIGRRTGKDVKEGKNIRKLKNGLENFDDYWSETDNEGSNLPLDGTTEISGNRSSRVNVTTSRITRASAQKQNQSRILTGTNSAPSPTPSPAPSQTEMSEPAEAAAGQPGSSSEPAEQILRDSSDNLNFEGASSGSIIREDSAQKKAPSSALQTYRTRQRLEFSSRSGDDEARSPADVNCRNVNPPHGEISDGFKIPKAPVAPHNKSLVEAPNVTKSAADHPAFVEESKANDSPSKSPRKRLSQRKSLVEEAALPEEELSVRMTRSGLVRAETSVNKSRTKSASSKKLTAMKSKCEGTEKSDLAQKEVKRKREVLVKRESRCGCEGEDAINEMPEEEWGVVIDGSDTSGSDAPAKTSTSEEQNAESESPKIQSCHSGVSGSQTGECDNPGSQATENGDQGIEVEYPPNQTSECGVTNNKEGNQDGTSSHASEFVDPVSRTNDPEDEGSPTSEAEEPEKQTSETEHPGSQTNEPEPKVDDTPGTASKDDNKSSEEEFLSVSSSDETPYSDEGIAKDDKEKMKNEAGDGNSVAVSQGNVITEEDREAPNEDALNNNSKLQQSKPAEAILEAITEEDEGGTHGSGSGEAEVMGVEGAGPEEEDFEIADDEEFGGKFLSLGKSVRGEKTARRMSRRSYKKSVGVAERGASPMQTGNDEVICENDPDEQSVKMPKSRKRKQKVSRIPGSDRKTELEEEDLTMKPDRSIRKTLTHNKTPVTITKRRKQAKAFSESNSLFGERSTILAEAKKARKSSLTWVESAFAVGPPSAPIASSTAVDDAASIKRQKSNVEAAVTREGNDVHADVNHVIQDVAESQGEAGGNFSPAENQSIDDHTDPIQIDETHTKMKSFSSSVLPPGGGGRKHMSKRSGRKKRRMSKKKSLKGYSNAESQETSDDTAPPAMNAPSGTRKSRVHDERSVDISRVQFHSEQAEEMPLSQPDFSAVASSPSPSPVIRGIVKHRRKHQLSPTLLPSEDNSEHPQRSGMLPPQLVPSSAVPNKKTDYTPKSILKHPRVSDIRQSLGGRPSAAHSELPSAGSSSPLHFFEVTESQASAKKKKKPVVKILAPDSPESGLRRSRRTRVKPLDWFRNERIVYEKRKSGGWVIAGIESPAVNDSKNTVEKIVKRELFKEKVRKARQRRAATTRNLSAHATLPPDISMDSYSSQIPVVNPCSGEEVLVECLKRQPDFVFRGPRGGPATEQDSMIVCKPLHQRAFSSGMVVLRARGEKPTQFVKTDSLIYVVKQGKILVKIHQTTSVVEADDMFFIPQGNTYSLKNLRDDEAKLWFFLLKGS